MTDAVLGDTRHEYKLSIKLISSVIRHLRRIAPPSLLYSLPIEEIAIIQITFPLLRDPIEVCDVTFILT